MDGICLKKLIAKNKALEAMLVCNIYDNQDLKCVKILKEKYLEDGETSIFISNSLPKGSRIWNFIYHCRHLVTNYLTWEIRNG